MAPLSSPALPLTVLATFTGRPSTEEQRDMGPYLSFLRTASEAGTRLWSTASREVRTGRCQPAPHSSTAREICAQQQFSAVRLARALRSSAVPPEQAGQNPSCTTFPAGGR